MSLEISPMHHSVVVGRGAEQLKVIMKGTGTQIMFPDADDPNIPAIKKSCVTITGQIKDVYAARQQLVVSRYLTFQYPQMDIAFSKLDGQQLAPELDCMHIVWRLQDDPKNFKNWSSLPTAPGCRQRQYIM